MASLESTQTTPATVGHITIDIVIAVRNEEEGIPFFISKLKMLSLPKGIELRVLFVEDSSTDKTRDILREFAKNNSNIDYIFLKKGFGQAAAIAFGLAHSSADAAIMMDVDGGHPLELIPVMAEFFSDKISSNNIVVVQAIRKSIESRNPYRDMGSFAFNAFFYTLTGIDTKKQNVYYRLVSREVLNKLLCNNRWKNFLRIDYATLNNADVKFIKFDAIERQVGNSKYNFRRLLSFAFTAVLSSISLPRFSILSLVAFLISVLMLINNHFLISSAIFGSIGIAAWKLYNMSKENIFDRFECIETSLRQE